MNPLRTISPRPLLPILPCLVAAFLLFLPPRVPAGQSPDALPLNKALGMIGLGPEDVSIRPDLSQCPFVLTYFRRWIGTPLNAPGEAQDIARGALAAASGPRRWLEETAAIAHRDLPPATPPSAPSPAHVLPPDLPEDLRGPVTLLLGALEQAGGLLKPLRSRLSPAEADLLERHLYPEALRGDPGETGEPGPDPGEWRPLLRVLDKIERTDVLRAGLLLTAALERALEALGRTGPWEGRMESLSFKTPLGRVEIGGTGPDTHDKEAVLILDLGGADTYVGRVAAGLNGKCALVVDLDGNDTYLGQAMTQGAGLFGVGILYDAAGDDLYRGGTLSQGAGLFGIGLLYDREGSDDYLGGSFTQAGALWGWGGLLDLGGEDIYQCRDSGQAWAGVYGVSTLLDAGGNDTYLSGRNTPDHREPDMNCSYSQGFAFGMRNVTGGGFALLADAQGNDRYHCGYFGQGSSYWMAVGILYDEQGKDSYTARRYAQGAGIHYSLGMLLDAAGDDRMVSWIVSQGCGHDYGVGLLVNQSGNDTYVSEGLSLGAAEANGIGLFADNAGDDGYENREGTAVGHLTPSRRTGGLGLFLDGTGVDRYTGDGGDGKIWGTTRFGIGLDDDQGETGPLALSPPPQSSEEPALEKKRSERERLLALLQRAEALPFDEKLRDLLILASHSGLERAIPLRAQQRILALDPRVSVPAMVERIDLPDVVALNFMGPFFGVYGALAGPALQEKARTEDPLTLARVLHYLGKLRDTRRLSTCLDLLGHASWRVRSGALVAVGDILDQDRLEHLIPLKERLEQSREKGEPAPLAAHLLKENAVETALRVLTRAAPLKPATARRIWKSDPAEGKSLRDPQRLASFLASCPYPLQGLLETWISDIRDSTHAALRVSPHLESPDPEVKRRAAFALGQLGHLPALPRLVACLGDPDRGVRDGAVLALARFKERAVPPLKAALAEKPAPAFRIFALDALGRTGCIQARDVVAGYRENAHAGVSRAAHRAFARLPGSP